jgi:exopolysaccharide biosynthesis polyprenyl glycosylphosphotransferase
MFSPKGLTSKWALLIVGDLALAMAAAYFGRILFHEDDFTLSADRVFPLIVATLLVLWFFSFYLCDLYRLDRPRSSFATLASLFIAAVCMGLLVAVAALMFPLLNPGRRFYLTDLAVTVALVFGWRLVATHLLAKWQTINVMVLGNSAYHDLIAREIERHGHVGYKLVANEVSSEPMVVASSRSPHARLSVSYTASVYSPRSDINILVVESSRDSLPIPPRELLRWRLNGTEVVSIAAFYERLTGKLPLELVDELSLVFSPTRLHSFWRLRIKRLIDIAVTVVIGILTLPVSLLTAIAIKLDSQGPVLYSQSRVGLHGSIFTVYKFRSMRVDAETGSGAVWAVRDDKRVTRVGRFIRRFRIDELPQLINVLKGDMSLVGPRPERPEMVQRLTAHNRLYDYRHYMQPGVTGWAQVCYSYGASVTDAMEKLAYDLYYVRNWSLTLDLQVLLQTVKVVLLGRGSR